MRVFLKILSVMFVSTFCSLSVVACNDKSNSKPVDFLAKISKIVTVDATNFYFDRISSSRFFTLRKDDMIDYSFTGDNPWVYGDANVFVENDAVWDKVAFAYGFDRTTSKDDIKNIMATTPIINVSFKYEYNKRVNLYVCHMIDFQVK